MNINIKCGTEQSVGRTIPTQPDKGACDIGTAMRRFME